MSLTEIISSKILQESLKNSSSFQLLNETQKNEYLNNLSSLSEPEQEKIAQDLDKQNETEKLKTLQDLLTRITEMNPKFDKMSQKTKEKIEHSNDDKAMDSLI